MSWKRSINILPNLYEDRMFFFDCLSHCNFLQIETFAPDESIVDRREFTLVLALGRYTTHNYRIIIIQMWKRSADKHLRSVVVHFVVSFHVEEVSLLIEGKIANCREEPVLILSLDQEAVLTVIQFPNQLPCFFVQDVSFLAKWSSSKDVVINLREFTNVNCFLKFSSFPHQFLFLPIY